MANLAMSIDAARASLHRRRSAVKPRTCVMHARGSGYTDLRLPHRVSAVLPTVDRAAV